MNTTISNRSMIVMVISILCLSVASAYAAPPLLEPIPVFTNYNINIAPNGYIIKGTIYAPGATPTPNAVMVVDPVQKRVAYYFAPIGIFITDETGSYHFNLRGSPVCFTNAAFKYSTYVTNYASIRAQPNSTLLDAEYMGYTRDSFSCNQNIHFTFREQSLSPGPSQPLIRATSALGVALPTPVTIPGVGSICAQAQAWFVGDPSTLDTDRSHFDQYFTLPANCTASVPGPTGPFDYCPLAYPAGNACETQYQH